MITIRNYVRAQSLEEAWELNQKKANRVIGGMMFLRLGKGTVATAIDLCDLGLSGITETEEQFEIGAMTPLRDLETHEGLNRYSGGAVREALCDIVGVQFRNMATVGGSLYGRYGFSDVLTVFLSMDSYVELYQGGILPLSEYAAAEHDRDLLLKLIIKKTPGKFAFRSVRLTKTDLPVLNCACSLLSGEVRTVLGARPMRATLVPDPRGILTGGLTENSVKDFADFCAATVKTGSNCRGSAAYRTHLVRVLVEENLKQIGGEE